MLGSLVVRAPMQLPPLLPPPVNGSAEEVSDCVAVITVASETSALTPSMREIHSIIYKACQQCTPLHNTEN